MRQARLILIPMMFSVVSGCSLLPYENKFSCSRTDKYGKCISMEGAYKESVTGESQGDYLVPASKQKGSGKKRQSGNDNVSGADGNEQSEYTQYQVESFRKMKGLLKSPKTPVLRPPVTVRTLVLSYSDRNRKSRLYMPRYVYSIIQDPQWVMGSYLDRKSVNRDYNMLPSFRPQKSQKSELK